MTLPRDLPNAEYHDKVLEFMNAWLEEGIAANKAEYNYDKIGAIIDAIMGCDEPRVISKLLSQGRLNRLQKIALELRSMLTDIKPFWEYEANSRRYEKQAEIFGKLAKNWYLQRGVDQTFRDAIDYVLAAGTGYVHFFWNPDLPGPPGKDGLPTQGDIDCRAEDPRDVILLRRNGDRRSVQGCRGVLIRRERPTSWLRDQNPKLAEFIKPDREGFEKESPSQRRYREAATMTMADKGPHYERLFGGPPENRMAGPAPVTDEFTAYLHDFQVHKGKTPVEMGEFEDGIDEMGNPTREPKYSWCYVVQPGERLYPFGRRIVFCRYGVLSDGPDHFFMPFHPVAKMTLDTWAWSWLGSAPLQALLPLQREVDETVRTIQNYIRRINRRDMRFDKNAVPSAMARRLQNPTAREVGGMAIATNPGASQKPIEYFDQPELSRVIPEWLKLLLEQMDDVSGVSALRSLSELGQMPSTETIDKIVESMTPLVKARSRSMEVFIREFAMMLASIFMQHYTLEMRLRILGPSGAVQEDWDYKPADLMPAYIRESDFTEEGGLTQEALIRGPEPDYIRNREFLRYFNYNVAPGSLLDYATITKKLMYLQLSRMGLIDHWTLLEVLQIPNVGSPPDWATDITTRLQAEAMMGLGMMASTAGRPPTAQAMPSMTSEGHISESG